MIKITTFVLAIFTALTSFNLAAQELKVGEVNGKALLTDYPKFSAEYQAFSPSDSDIKAMAKLEGKDLLVLFGTWCHDSQREVPRLLRLLEQSDVELNSLSLVAVDYNKQDEQGLAEQFELKYTPTFIVLENEQELHRVVEKPQGTLAQDLVNF